MQPNHLHCLAITALGSDQIGIIEVFTKLSKQSGCNILNSKAAVFGSECALLFHVSGSWHAIAKLEASLPLVAKDYEYAIQSKRTLPEEIKEVLPYQIQVIAQDKPGILNDLAIFFAQQGVNIAQMEGEIYQAKNSTLLANITLLASIPAKKHIATLREKFMIYCEDRNLDAVIEPFKN